MSLDVDSDTQSMQSYQVEKTIARGGYGDVKIARHCITGERVAVKIFEKSQIVSNDDYTRVVREI